MSLARYFQDDKARFDFRIWDGMGSYLEPDWQDENLRVEFYDSENTLRFTATVQSTPRLSSALDEEGKFVYVDGILLEEFSLGLCSAKIYCLVNGAEVFPYPTVVEAFQVVSGTGIEPVYSLVSKVRTELPSNIPAELTDFIIEQYIYDASRRIDFFLYGYYSVPFPGIEQSPATPALIERICRKLALADSLVFLGMVNQAELNSSLEEQALAELERLRKGEIRLSGYHPPSSVYLGKIYQEDSCCGEVLD